MTAKGKQYRLEHLPVADVRQEAQFQMRAKGIDVAWVNQLHRRLVAGEDLTPIKVARIGHALYAVDGFHRLQAHDKARRPFIWAEVARMSKPEALDAARAANTAHGKGLGRADKQRNWNSYVGEGLHLRPDGKPKGSTVIMREIHGMYSPPTIRQKLKDLGLEVAEDVEFPQGYKSRFSDEDAEENDDLAQVLLWEAGGHLERFRAAYLTLEPQGRQEIIETARALVEALERGETPGPVKQGPLDI